MKQQGPKLLGSTLLRCKGCGRAATANRMSAERLADLLSWHRADDGDWCIECQWRRGHTPRLAHRIGD